MFSELHRTVHVRYLSLIRFAVMWMAFPLLLLRTDGSCLNYLHEQSSLGFIILGEVTNERQLPLTTCSFIAVFFYISSSKFQIAQDPIRPHF